VGSSRADIRALPEAARHQLGTDLREVQNGGMPGHWKPMPTVGAGVIEIRVRMGGAFRLLYVAKFAEAVYVLHVFQKKSQKTSPLDLEVARTRLAAVLRGRQGG
jgi:phage-related protein